MASTNSIASLIDDPGMVNVAGCVGNKGDTLETLRTRQSEFGKTVTPGRGGTSSVNGLGTILWIDSIFG